MQPRIALYSPAKAPDDPTPSGERTIVRNLQAALGMAGFVPELVSDLRLLDKDGDAARQTEIALAAQAEATRIIHHYASAPPALWYTYHCYYKCPDLIGPTVTKALDIPYVIQQPSLSPKREHGPWADFAKACRDAILAASLLFWTTRRDLQALENADLPGRLVHLPPIVPMDRQTVHRGAQSPLRLLTVAMMREGDKLESYRRLAKALGRLEASWQLRIVGDGPARPHVEALFQAYPGQVTWLGMLEGCALEAEYNMADLFVWPGVGEGVGMVYLEAQALGVPVVAEDHPAQHDVVFGKLARQSDPVDFAARIRAMAADRESRSRTARGRIVARHTTGAVSRILRSELTQLIQ